MICNIRSKICGHTVISDNNTVLVIAIGGGLQPQCSILLINISIIFQFFDRSLNLVRVKGTLAEPVVEGNVKAFQILLEGCKLFLQSQFLENCKALLLAHGQILVPVLVDNALGGIDDIRTMVSIFRELAGFSKKLKIAGIDRSCQIVHLISCIIDIVLAIYRISCCTEKIYQCTSSCSTTAMSNMQRAGWVGTYILNHDWLHVLLWKAAVLCALIDNLLKRIIYYI